ncbi:MAG TPA: 30S ribosomal protein S12 methylthiotransferase RimO [Clostridia bacterium]|nr:30S ribosomal protein S12 methylthiotransferase RimO [Clostridia bacterium]
MKFYIHELGCAKNTDDVNHMKSLLVDYGHLPLESPEEAETIIIHTCGFIEEAVSQSIEAILDLADFKEFNCNQLIVSGCLAQRYQESLLKELPEVDLFLGTSYSHRIQEFINKKGAYFDSLDFNLSTFKHLSANSSYAYVKIAEGCDNFCSYCIIPSLRGPMRSKSIDQIVIEAENLASQGIKEIILIAQDLSRYGEDRGKRQLLELLASLNAIEGIYWIRLQYVYPDLLDEAFFHKLAELSKVVPYLDMPIQHASDSVLRKMNRHTSQEDLRKIITMARQIIPNIVLRTTVMVGFPGESEEDFELLLDFVKEISFDKLGAFKYSDEEDAASYLLPNKISDQIKEERYQRLMNLQKDISEKKLDLCVGKTMDVLVDEIYEDSWIGRTKGDSPDVDGIVYVKGKDVSLGDILKVKIVSNSEYDLIGEVNESTK